MKQNLIRQLAAGCLGALLSCAATASYGGNLLLNHSFESGTSNTDADFWTFHSGDTFREDTNSFGFTGPAMYDGNFGVKMFGAEGDAFQANIPVFPNTDYEGERLVLSQLDRGRDLEQRLEHAHVHARRMV